MKIKLEKKLKIELEILGACIYYPSLIDLAKRILTQKDFSSENSKIFSIICELDECEQLSSELIIDYFKNSEFDIGDLISIGSKQVENEFLFEQKLKRFLDLKFSIVAENKLIANLEKIKASEQGLDLLIELRNEIDSLIETNGRFQKEKNFFECLPDIISEIELERNGKSESLNSLRFPSFNRCTKGLLPGNLCTVAGAWKNGKTTFGLNVILDISFNENVPIGIFSLEMNKKEIARKLLGMYVGVDYEKLRNPKSLIDSDVSKLKQNAIKEFVDSKIYINNKLLNNENEIRAITKNWVKNYGVKIILVDYIGLIKTSQKGKSLENRERELSFISQFLKHMATELNIPIISLAQLNRQGLTNPSTENLAESIGIARDSDFIFTIYKPLTTSSKINITVDGKGIPIKENHFVVKLSDSRHTKSGDHFLLELDKCGLFREITSNIK